MSDQKKLYTEGFNSGYLLSKHEPDLTTTITQSLQPNTEYLEGFFSGKEEYELENPRKQLDELLELKNQRKDRGKDLEYEK